LTIDRDRRLFCQELTLGARLLSTKYLMKDEWSDMEKEKQQMKISVGASVQTQYGGVGHIYGSVSLLC
jgi:hypothetical protein